MENKYVYVVLYIDIWAENPSKSDINVYGVFLTEVEANNFRNKWIKQQKRNNYDEDNIIECQKIKIENKLLDEKMIEAFLKEYIKE